jgi:hypothetical protein
VPPDSSTLLVAANNCVPHRNALPAGRALAEISKPVSAFDRQREFASLV